MADEAYVREGLAPYAARIRQVVERGYADWLNSSDRRFFIYERSRANARFDHVARHAHLEFDSDDDIEVREAHETIKLLFCKGTIVLRFKHADEDGLGVNGHVTQTVLAFIDELQPYLPGISQQHKVECCFRQNDLDTALESVTMVGRHLFKKLWSYELPKPEAEILPFTATPPDQGPPEVRPRASNTDAKKESEEDSGK